MLEATPQPTLLADSAPTSHDTAGPKIPEESVGAAGSAKVTNIGTNSPIVTANEYLRKSYPNKRHLSQRTVTEPTTQPSPLVDSVPTPSHETAGSGKLQESVDTADLVDLTNIEANNLTITPKQHSRKSYYDNKTPSSTCHLEPTPQPSPFINSPLMGHETADFGTAGGPQLVSNTIDRAGPVGQVTSDPETTPPTSREDIVDLQGGLDYAMSPKICHQKIDEHEDQIVSGPGHIPSPKPTHAASPPAKPHHTHTTDFSVPVFGDAGHTTTPNATIQPRSTVKSKSQTHLSRKRPAKDPDGSGKHTKHAKQVQPPHLNRRRDHLKQKLRGKAKATPTTKGKVPYGHGVLLRHHVGSVKALMKPSAHARGPQAASQSQCGVAENEDEEEWRPDQHDNNGGSSPSNDEIEGEMHKSEESSSD